MEDNTSLERQYDQQQEYNRRSNAKRKKQRESLPPEQQEAWKAERRAASQKWRDDQKADISHLPEEEQAQILALRAQRKEENRLRVQKSRANKRKNNGTMSNSTSNVNQNQIPSTPSNSTNNVNQAPTSTPSKGIFGTAASVAYSGGRMAASAAGYFVSPSMPKKKRSEPGTSIYCFVCSCIGMAGMG